MRALFTFSYILRIVVIHFILIESSIVYAKKYQIVRTESNSESLEKQQNWTSPTYEKKISKSNILKKNPSDITFRRNGLTELGRKNELLFNESVNTPIEDGRNVVPSEKNFRRSGRRCLLAGMLHKKLQYAKKQWFGRPLWSPPKFILPRPRLPLLIRFPKLPCKRKRRTTTTTTTKATKRPTTEEQTTQQTIQQTTPQTTEKTTKQSAEQAVPTTSRSGTKRRRPTPPRTTPGQKLTPYRWTFVSTSTPSFALQTTIPNKIEERPTEPQGYVLPKPTPAAPWQELQSKRPPSMIDNSLGMKFKPTRTGTIVAGCKFLANPGVVVMNGIPKYDIRSATVVEKIILIQRLPGYFAWEFVHPIKNVCIELPASVDSDTYVDPVTKKIFIIFVDNTNTTLLIPKLKPLNQVSEICIFNYSKQLILEKYWKGWRLGSSVVNGLPLHNIREAIWVWHAIKMIDSDGILIYEFTHPINKHAVRIPVFGTDEYFIRETSQVFLLFVDRRNRTLAIYKGVLQQHKSVREDQKFGHLKREDEIRLIEKYREFGYKYGWGSIVIGGLPKYDLRAAQLVNKTEKIIDNDGFLVTQFEHPITGQRIQIPPNSGDEYVLPSVSKKFEIFVDSAKRTLLIVKDEFESNSMITRDCVDKLNRNVTLAIFKYQQLTYKVHLGAMVINGVPTYDISTAIFVNETYNVIDTDGFLMTYFIHPKTGKSIQIPFDGSDEYVLEKESKVYVIFVDNVGQTLLIFKDNNLKKQGKPLREKTQGSIVINGFPKYNASCVIFVNKTDKLLHSQKIPVIQFVHPITGEKIQIPADGGDEFMVPSTLQIFLIFVDSQDRTLLIFKDKYVPKQPKNGNDSCPNILSVIKKYQVMARDREWGSMVVHGVPKYNKSCGIFVNKSENIIDSDGCMVIQFVHPITEQKIKIPANGGDEYVMPSTAKIFVIFVDTKGRTLLISKHERPPNEANPAHNHGGNCTNVLYAINKYRQLTHKKELGSMVIHGVPKYDTSFGIFVYKTNKILDSDGCVVIEFVDPSTGQKIQIPYYGGDEFVVPSISKIFIIFVDNKDRTLFVFKEQIPNESKAANDSSAKCKNMIDAINKYQQMAREKEWGSMVIRGVPKYNTSSVIFVHKTNKTLDSDGCLRIEFMHPITKQDIQIPYTGGDEFMMPLLSKIFVIFLDAKDRTLLIFKESYPSDDTKATDDPGDKNKNTSDAIKKYQEIAKEKESGSMVIHGVPTYNISGAIFVDETDQVKDSDGFLLIHFVHPITGQNIKIPYYGGDSYALPYTPKIYVIFVDTKGRTLLILKPQRPSKTKIEENNENVSFAIKKYGEIAKENEWGWLVIRGVPKYDVPSAIFVNNTENKIDSDGFLVIQFTHPIKGQKILIPYHGGDEYVLPKTSKIYLIFVDNKDRTLLILKNKYPSSETKLEKDLDDTNKNQFNFAIKKYQEIANKNEWGWMVIRGVPKYDTSSAIFVNETEKKVDPDGCLIIQFVHPITGQKIQIPYHGGDEYVLPITSKIYIIFVDTKNRTLLILKKVYPSNERKPEDDLNDMRENVSFAIKKYQDIANKNKWGWIVIRGVPKYDTSKAIYVNNTENKIDSDGFLVIQFMHPITEQKIVIPYHGGDEFVLPRTLQMYVIFVDIKDRTLLILKNEYPSNEYPSTEMKLEKVHDIWLGKQSVADNVNSIMSTPIDKKAAALKKWWKLSMDKGWGWLVVKGVPKYDLSQAIFVMKSEKKKIGKYDIEFIRFLHPVTGQMIEVPLVGSDELVLSRTSRVFLIFVDLQGRTLLILKDNGKKLQNIGWGNVVVDGYPKYDLSQAIYVIERETTISNNGTVMLQFVHPKSREKVRMPFSGGDEYTGPLTSKIFVIVVDSRGKTLLIFKGMNEARLNDRHKEKIDMMIKKYNTQAQINGWGSLVIRGMPMYDLSSGIIVMETKTKIQDNGMVMIQFQHPKNKRKMMVPFIGGDEYVDSLTSNIYLMFVDLQRQLILIFKGIKNSEAFEPMENLEIGSDRDKKELDRFIKEYKALAHRNKWGTLVTNGVPNYNLENAILVKITNKTWTNSGFPIIRFVHPINAVDMYVPTYGSDEYVDPKTLRKFIIFVDTQHRTCLISKENYKNNTFNYGSNDPAIMENIENIPIKYPNEIDDSLQPSLLPGLSSSAVNNNLQGHTILIPEGKGSSGPKHNISTPMDELLSININKNINNNVFLPR